MSPQVLLLDFLIQTGSVTTIAGSLTSPDKGQELEETRDKLTTAEVMTIYQKHEFLTIEIGITKRKGSKQPDELKSIKRCLYAYDLNQFPIMYRALKI